MSVYVVIATKICSNMGSISQDGEALPSKFHSGDVSHGAFIRWVSVVSPLFEHVAISVH